MNPYVSYKISGLDGITIKQGNLSFTPNDSKINSVQMILDDKNDISQIKFLLTSDAIIDEAIIQYLQKKILFYIIDIIGCLDVYVTNLHYEVCDIINPNKEVEKNNTLILKSSFGIKCSVTLKSAYDISRYESIFSRNVTYSNNEESFITFAAILKINNILIRYLMQYEFLLKLVAPDRKQYEVTKYIRNIYNPTLNFNKIGFHKTRKPGKNYKEDNITYYRNILAHNDIAALNKEKNIEKTINDYSYIINKVIYFALARIPC